MRAAVSWVVAALLVAGGIVATAQQETQAPKKVDKAEVARVLRCQLPEGKGKDTVVRLCADCHAARVVSTARKTPDEWLQTVETMADKGINASDDDFNTVVEYLAANLGPDKPAPADAAKKDGTPDATKTDNCPKQPEATPAAPPQ